MYTFSHSHTLPHTRRQMLINTHMQGESFFLHTHTNTHTHTHTQSQALKKTMKYSERQNPDRINRYNEPQHCSYYIAFIFSILSHRLTSGDRERPKQTSIEYVNRQQAILTTKIHTNTPPPNDSRLILYGFISV